MASFKNIRIEKRGGGTRIQRVQVLASGKYKFVKNVGVKKSSKAKSSTKPTRKVKKRMARRKRRRRNAKTIPIAAVGGALAGLAIPPATSGGGMSPINAAMAGDFNWVMEGLVENYTGMNIYTGQWNIINARGLWAAIAGIVGHKAASMLGVNRTLARAGIPLIRI